mmetsp:Transcript_5012/g.14391  ORF Transcript_5012/g.14391 Transcript_5012/m.14391 type:complete len:226 (-) Transcript_5012:1304-1981(-)
MFGGNRPGLFQMRPYRPDASRGRPWHLPFRPLPGPCPDSYRRHPGSYPGSYWDRPILRTAPTRVPWRLPYPLPPPPWPVPNAAGAAGPRPRDSSPPRRRPRSPYPPGRREVPGRGGAVPYPTVRCRRWDPRHRPPPRMRTRPPPIVDRTTDVVSPRWRSSDRTCPITFFGRRDRKRRRRGRRRPRPRSCRGSGGSPPRPIGDPRPRRRPRPRVPTRPRCCPRCPD